MDKPAEHISKQVSELLGFEPEQWTFINRGYTAAKRYVVQGGGGTAFVKIGAAPLTARLLNQEVASYNSLSGPFLPKLLAWRSDDAMPILIIEDLSSALWPPPWTDEVVRLVIEQIGDCIGHQVLWNVDLCSTTGENWVGQRLPKTHAPSYPSGWYLLNGSK